MPDEPLSVVLIQIDSLSRHFLTTYGNDWVRTPNLADLASRSCVFEQHYAGSLPCMPARREIWTGTEEHWWRPWGPLEPWDQPIAHLAGGAGVTTGLVTDHYHFFEWGAHSYAYDFDSYQFIRGHEHDNWRSDPVDEPPDWAASMLRGWPETELYVRNVLGFSSEADYFAPQVMTAAAEWLERNRARQRFYLHVDSFDVHEPFHVPEPYRSMYTDLDYRAFSPWAKYGRTDDPAMGFTPEYLEWLRAQFAGKLTMVDTWLGRILDTLDKHKLWERTAVIVTTDHGHYLGEHDRVGKPGSPLWHTLTHIPLIAWLPGGPRNGQRVNAVTQTVDLYATVLELLGVKPPEREHVHSRSFTPVLRGERATHRDRAVYGYASERAGITADGWTLLRDQDPRLAPAHWYTHEVAHMNTRSVPARHQRQFEFPDLEAGRFIPGLDTPVWRMPPGSYAVRNLQPPRPDLLYDNAQDPGQQSSLALERPDKVAELEGLLRDHAMALRAPEEQLRRLRLI